MSEQSDIEALEYMKNSMELWDKVDSINTKETSNDAQRNRIKRKSSETLRTEDCEGGTALRELSEETGNSEEH